MAGSRPPVVLFIAVSHRPQGKLPADLVERLTGRKAGNQIQPNSACANKTLRRSVTAAPAEAAKTAKTGSHPPLLAWEKAQRGARAYLARHSTQMLFWRATEAARDVGRRIAYNAKLAGAEGRRRRRLAIRASRARHDLVMAEAARRAHRGRTERRAVERRLESLLDQRWAATRRRAILRRRASRAAADYWSARISGLHVTLERHGKQASYAKEPARQEPPGKQWHAPATRMPGAQFFRRSFTSSENPPG